MAKSQKLEPEGYTILFHSGEHIGLLADRVIATSGMVTFFRRRRVMAMYPVSAIASVLHYVQEYEMDCARAARAERTDPWPNLADCTAASVSVKTQFRECDSSSQALRAKRRRVSRRRPGLPQQA